MRLILLVSVLVASQLFAQEKISLRLQKLEVIQPQEQRGDEIFLHITEFPLNSKPKHYYIPHRPAHWLSKHLAQVQNINLWQKQGVCEPTNVLISLVEEDAEPWNINDLLGSVMLRIKCENGKINKEWSIPDSKNTSYGDVENVFQFQGKNANYRATFLLE